MTFSEAVKIRIETLCKEKEYNTFTLANKAGLNDSTVRSILTGHTQCPKAETLYYISLGFNMSLSEFFDAEVFDIENIEDN